MYNKLFIIALIFSFGCGFEDDKKDAGIEEITKSRCIKHKFADGTANNIYGRECFEGKHLLIKTSKEGDLVSTTNVSESNTGLKLDKDLSFQNKFYNVSYKILKGQGDDKNYPLLLNYLNANEKFQGQKDTEYHIIFKTDRDYLKLYQASKSLKDIPHTKIDSLKIWRDGKAWDYDPKSYKNKEGDYYMTPLIGYSVRYCNPKSIITSSGERTFESRPVCNYSYSDKAPYIETTANNKRIYNHRTKEKKDYYPSDYFNGIWFFSEGPIETPTREGEIAPINAHLVKIRKEKNNFYLLDVSGEIEERNRKSIAKIPVKWNSFEPDLNGNKFISFGERNNTDEDAIKRPYVKINFEKMEPGGLKESELIELIITQDYLSYVHRVNYEGHTVKWKTSFLRAKAVNSEGFTPKRWFKDDHDQVFGVLWANPQDERKRAEITEDSLMDHLRMIRFNISLNTPEEKRTKTKTINWHFSKNSTKDTEYRKVAKKAVQIYNQAFEHISKSSDTKIRVKLIETEEKDLGDLRYNIINLVKAKDLLAGSVGLLGLAPSYVNPNTGQIVGTTANIIIHNQEAFFDSVVRNYIRYEIFQTNKRTDKENEIHVVSPHLRSEIQEKCPQVKEFINQKKQAELKPSTDLKDKDIVISCGKQLTKQALLGLILHEMGHSFGLAHNFKASTDSKNYYHSVEEVKAIFPDIDSHQKIANFSSIMDYGSSDQLEMRYLGKYDLAALRYLYFDKVELKDGSYEDLNINSDPKQQTALNEKILKERKNYLHCSDFLKETEFMCDPLDYGRNPKEIIQEQILSIKRKFNNFRYRYDISELLFSKRLQYRINLIISEFNPLLSYYNNWLRLRDSYLKQKGLDPIFALNDQKSIDNYKTLIKKGKKDNEEYALYYPVRELISDFMKELIQFEEMKCLLKDSEGKVHTFSLEDIKNHLKYDYGNNLYVEDCRSFQVMNFFKKNSLTLEEETGYENFERYLATKNPQSKKDVIPISHLIGIINPFILANPQLKIGIGNQLYNFLMREPDFLKDFNLIFQENLLDIENKTLVGIKKNDMLLSAIAANLIESLSSPDKQPFLIEHLNNIKNVKYSTGKAEGSFYEEVMKHLDKGESIESIKIPFLTIAHKEYLQSKRNVPTEYHNPSFQDYLQKKRDVFYNKEKLIFIIPFETDSFSAQMIKKYNENSDKLKRLNKKASLSAVEKLNKTVLTRYLTTLKIYIEKWTQL